jgi:hypothetical protein
MILEYLAMLNNNKILWGISMILLNMGSRYVIADIGKLNEKILANELFKKVILYAMFFVATRDLIVSFLLTILYTILIDGILHEKRNFHIFKNIITVDRQVSEQEYNNAKGIIKRYEEQKAKKDNSSEQQDMYMNYLNNLNIIKTK